MRLKPMNLQWKYNYSSITALAIQVLHDVQIILVEIEQRKYYLVHMGMESIPPPTPLVWSS